MLGTGTAKIFWSSFKTYALGGGQGNSPTPGTGIVGRIRNHLRIDASHPARWIRSQGLPMDSNCLTILKWQWCWAIYTCIDVYFQSTYIYICICIFSIIQPSRLIRSTLPLPADPLFGAFCVTFLCKGYHLLPQQSWQNRGKTNIWFCLVWKVIGKNTGKIGGHPILNPIHFSR